MSKRAVALIVSIKEFLSMLLYCLKLSWKSSKLYTIIRVCAQMVNSAIMFVTAYLGRDILNILAGKSTYENQKQFLIVFVVSLFLLSILTKSIGRLRDYASSMQSDNLSRMMNLDMLKISITADLGFFDSPKFYNAFENAKRDVYAVTGIVWNVIDGVSSFATLIGTFIILSRINVMFGILMVIMTIPSSIVSRQYTTKLYRWNREHIKEERKMGYLSAVLSIKNYAQDVRLFNIGGILLERYKSIWATFFAARKKVVRKYAFLTTTVSCLPEICTSGILLVMSFRIIDGLNSIGDYSLYGGMLAQLGGSLFGIVSIVTRIYEDRMKIENVRKFEKMENVVLNLGTKQLSGPFSIEFKNVCFTYPSSEKQVLNSISFSMGKEEKAAIVGVNGAGKTTIIKLLLRFYDVTEGEILINGINIKEYELGSLRKCFSSFFQHVVNYAFTLRENIKLSDMDKSNGSDDEVIKALELSDAISILEKAPDGLDTYMTKNFEENGMELSGGQNQKIALARTFYRDSQVVILDEPSASLDPEAEYRIFQSLDKLCEGKTAIFTSHRLCNVIMADKIIVIEGGAVLEQGTHKELMEKDGRYAELFNYQANKYVKVPVKR